MNAKDLSGLFFLVFLGLSLLMTLVYFGPALSHTGRPAQGEIIKGVWTSRFEKSFGEALPVYDPSRNLWGRAEYALFHQGRKGVIVGDDGWLYTDEELSCPKGNAKTFSGNLAFIKKTKEQLAKNGTALAVVLVPAKARVLASHLGKNHVPSCRTNIYSAALDFFHKEKITAVNLLAPMNSYAQPDRLYLKTDTHWTPAGAQLSAKILAKRIFVPLPGDHIYKTRNTARQDHKGDLMRYTPGVENAVLKAESIRGYSTTLQSGPVSKADLFGDDVPPITLVGTSYSANPLWNFEGFLKQFLKTDILNVADEGQGPFAVMTKYLESKPMKNSPPKLVIWEIPERYLVITP